MRVERSSMLPGGLLASNAHSRKIFIVVSHWLSWRMRVEHSSILPGGLLAHHGKDLNIIAMNTTTFENYLDKNCNDVLFDASGPP